jgi:hypothetical protein
MGKKIISFSLYGNDPKYYLGAEQNIIEAKEIYSDWICRFYCKKNVPNFDKLKNIQDIEFISVDDSEIIPTIYLRFLAIDDKDVDVCIFRDCDSIVNSKEKIAVDEWLKSDKILHTMHDNNGGHFDEVMAGMWGMKKVLNYYIREKIINFLEKENKKNYVYRDDQIFLKKYILKDFENSWIDHNSTSTYRYKSSVNFPDYKKIKYGTFVGEIIAPNLYLNIKKNNKDKLFLIGNQAEMDHTYLFESLDKIINKYSEIVVFIRKDRKDFCDNLYQDKFKNIKFIVGEEKEYLNFYNNIFKNTHDFLGLGVFNKNFKGIYTKETIIEDMDTFNYAE